MDKIFRKLLQNILKIIASKLPSFLNFIIFLKVPENFLNLARSFY